MSTREIDRMIARYLESAMSLEEEEEFFVRMALDSELRQSYQAQRVVESALRKQRQSAPRAAVESRARFAAMIAPGNEAAPVNANVADSLSANEARMHDVQSSSVSSSLRLWARAIALGIVIGVAAVVVVEVAQQNAAPTTTAMDSVATESISPLDPPARRFDTASFAEPVVTGAIPPSAATTVENRIASSTREIDRRGEPTTSPGAGIDSTANTLTPANAVPPVPSAVGTESARTARDAARDSEQSAVDTIKMNVRVRMP